MKNWVCTQGGEYFNLRYIQEIYILEVNVNKFSIRMRDHRDECHDLSSKTFSKKDAIKYLDNLMKDL